MPPAAARRGASGGASLLAILLACAAAGCAPRRDAATTPPAGRPAPDTAPVPPLPTFTAVAPTSEERLADARQVLLALDPGSPARAALRLRLARHLAAGLPAALARGQGLRGVKRYEKLLGLYGDAAPRVPNGRALDPEGILTAASRAVVKTFKRRGVVHPTLTALAVLEAVDPAHRAACRKTFDAIVSWLEDVEEPLVASLKPGLDAHEALEQAFRLWPSEFVRERLAAQLARQHRALRPLGVAPKVPGQRRFREALDDLYAYPWQRLRLLLLRPDGGLSRARRYLESLRSDPLSDPHLVRLAEAALGAERDPDPWLDLAAVYAPRYPRFARHLCRRALRMSPGNAAAHHCLGTLALRAEETLLALRHFSAAARSRPEFRPAWQQLAATYLDRLVSLLGQERLAEVRKEVAFLERLHGAARLRWPAEPLKASLAEVYLVLGRGLYNEGQVDEARSTLRKALDLKRTPQAYALLGQLYYWQGQYEAALTRLRFAFSRISGGAAWKAYWELRTAPLRVRAHRRLAAALRARARQARRVPDRVSLQRQAKTHEASASLLVRRGLGIGKVLLSNFRSGKLRAEILVEAAKLFWLAGRRRIAVESFDAALDQAPENASTYVEVISFLVMRGYFDEALDAYHRALARDKVSEYLKAYATFWILDLGRRLRVDPEKLRLAEVYLAHLRGKRWYHQLARYFRGALSYEALRRRARTTGQRVEADFYHAMARYRAGDRRTAERLLRAVVASNMMAFFEYKMARHYLEHGPPTQAPKRDPSR